MAMHLRRSNDMTMLIPKRAKKINGNNIHFAIHIPIGPGSSAMMNPIVLPNATSELATGAGAQVRGNAPGRAMG